MPVKREKAFTLAELILTMTIVGSIASFTIPSMVQNIQNAYLKIAWKGAYGIINQATSRIFINSGGSFLNYFNDEYEMREQYAKYIKTIRKCPYNESYGNCFAPVGDIKYYNGQVLNSTQVDNDFGLSSPGMIVNNGFSIVMMSYPECPTNPDGRRYCGWLAVDVNGPKSPNTIGKDIFRIWLLGNGIIPQGRQGSNIESDCGTYGWKCGAMYLMQ